MTDLQRVLSVASINGIKGGWEKPKDRTFVARFRGRAVSVKTSSTQYGDYDTFLGNFLAWNMKGDEFVGNKLIVPEPAQGLIHAALMTREEGVASVEFAFDMFIVPDTDPRNARGYKFVTATIMDDVGETYSAMRQGLPPLPVNKQIKG